MSFVIAFVFITSFCIAQKRLPNVIENKERKRIEHARKLLNEGEFIEGLKILTKLRDENPHHAYFNEALVRIQKQILEQAGALQREVENEGEYFLHGKKEGENIPDPELKVKNVFIDNGLARNIDEKAETVNNLKGSISRKERKKIEKVIEIKKEKSIYQDSSKVSNDLLDESDLVDFKIKRKKNNKGKDELATFDLKFLRQDLINNCRIAVLKNPEVDSASHFLRLLLIDTLEYTENFSEADFSLYEEALIWMSQKNYVKAGHYFDSLCTLHPEHFYSFLYLSDALSKYAEDSITLKSIKYVAQKWPERPEGFQRLSYYYYNHGQFTTAAEYIIEAILRYPEHAYWVDLSKILYQTGRKFNMQWIERGVFPIKTDKNYEEIYAKEKSPWLHYQQAKSVLYSYAFPTGLLRENEITSLPYLELYGWKTMLVRGHTNMKKTETIPFPFARSMDKMGYIDCYVFLNLFHPDMYDSYKDFVKNNPKKVHDFFYILINWEESKFDKYRVK